MPTTTPPDTPTFGSAASPGAVGSPRLRVGDAERTAVADRLSESYAEGRLDRPEFDDRLERALSAKTVADLDGLLAGLPGAPATTGTPAPGRSGPGRTRGAPAPLRRRGPGSHRVLVLLLVVLVTAAVGQELLRAAPVWPLVVLAVVVLVRHQRRPDRRRHR